MLRKILTTSPLSIHLGLLLFRLGVGVLMLTHGIPKLLNFSERMHTFRDPLGVGSALSLGLATFAEVGCSVLLTLGLFTRPALVPLIVTMGVVVFLVQLGQPFGKMELPLFYLIAFVVLFITGPGRYSVDGVLWNKARP